MERKSYRKSYRKIYREIYGKCPTPAVHIANLVLENPKNTGMVESLNLLNLSHITGMVESLNLSPITGMVES